MPKIFHPLPDTPEDVERAFETLAMIDPGGKLHRGSEHINPHIETTYPRAVCRREAWAKFVGWQS